jgi:GAF domain-containing protein
MTYPTSANDSERVAKLHSLGILDSSPDQNFDRIVRLCQDIFGVEIATISLVDSERQWFKSVVGLEVCETDRDVAFCNYTIMGDDIFEVTDALAHPDFAENALVTGPPHIRYYAGAPFSYDGFKMGAVCLIDSQPRAALDERERSILEGLASVVQREIRVQRMLRESLAMLTTIVQNSD